MFSFIRYLLALGCLAGCSNEPAQSVVIFAGSSMSHALDEMESAFESAHPEIDLQFVCAGSQTLAMQINEGAPADIFISANKEQILRVQNYSDPKILVHNQIVGITTLQNDSKPQSFQEAFESAQRIVVAYQEVPIGHYTYNALNTLGLWEAAQGKIVSYEHSAMGVLTKITMKQADLGFVYRTDAFNARDKVHTIELPADAPIETHTWIAIQNDSNSKESPASIVYQFILNAPESYRILTGLGFVLPEQIESP